VASLSSRMMVFPFTLRAMFSTGLNPTEEKTRMDCKLGTVIVKFPLASVTVERISVEQRD
jgi:hypothetical protein